jgi:hypothetical protein
MNEKLAMSILVLSALIGCNSSKPAPKPFKWESDTPFKQALEAERKAEANDPCSERNFRNATEAQKEECDPMRDTFDHIRPRSQPPQKQQKTTQTTKSVQPLAPTNRRKESA